MALLSVFRAVVPTRGRFVLPPRAVRRILSSSSYRSQDATKDYPSRPGRIILESPFPPVTIPDMTLPEYVWQNVDKWADSTAMVCAASGLSYTYRALRDESRGFACALLLALGLRPGDTLGVHLHNSPLFAAVVLGANEAALVVTFSNPLYTPDEVRRQYAGSKVRCCVTSSALLGVVREAAPDLPVVVVDADDDCAGSRALSYRRLVRESRRAELPRADPASLAALPYSSGTTGAPKGVMLSHRNLVSNLQMVHHPDLSFFRPSSATSHERVLSVIPLYHIYGYNTIMNVVLRCGAELITLPKFVPEDYLNALLKYKPTFLFVVPSLMLFLATHPSVTSEHLRSVEKMMSGAAPAPKNLIQKFRAKADHIETMQGYGMTEASPVLLVAHHHFPRSKTGSAGQVTPSTQCRVVDVDSGRDLGPHQPGQLLFRGPQVMMGYFDNPEATRETLDEEGWLHTGDVAYYDEEGYTYIVDRTKELIKVKGNQVSPTELENIIIELPGVTDVAVVGVPDERAGEIPRAFVVLGKDSPVTECDIVDHLEPRVAPYKRLAGGVRFVDAIPRSPAGKVLRQQLKTLV
ncbi:uncharacterized protein LOC134533057 [Bacillus rossius redtenbacheri]|uniref:uncharacterized protein LOC134533057 n=1 Tax=Bacillus rossius redtenbacheri TaxID=93214 RepID=UPI002FDE073C